MAVPTAITDLSTTAASNSPAGGDPILPDLDNYLRAFAAFIRQNHDALAGKQATLGFTPVNRAGDTMTGALAAIKGSTSAPGMAFAGDTNTGLHSPAADVLDLVTAGASRWRVDASGRLVHPARTQPCFRGRTSANRTTEGIFDNYSVEVDDSGAFDASTGVFAAPIDGWYEFSASIRVAITLGAGSANAVGYISDAGGVSHAIGQVNVTPGTTLSYINLSTGPVRMSAGQVARVRFTTHGTAHTLGDSFCVFFSGRLIG